MLILFLRVFLAFILINLSFYLVGGVLYYFTNFKRIGHYLVAVSGFRPSWLSLTCPYTPGTCRIWNCPNFHIIWCFKCLIIADGFSFFHIFYECYLCF